MADSETLLSVEELLSIVEEALSTCEVGVWVDRPEGEHLWVHTDEERARRALRELGRRANEL